MLAIRPYRPEDFPGIERVHDRARCVELRYAGLEDAFLPLRIAAEREDLRLSFVSQYYVSDQNRRPHVLVMNYSGLEERQIPEAVARLCRAVEG